MDAANSSDVAETPYICNIRSGTAKMMAVNRIPRAKANVTAVPTVREVPAASPNERERATHWVALVTRKAALFDRAL